MSTNIIHSRNVTELCITLSVVLMVVASSEELQTYLYLGCLISLRVGIQMFVYMNEYLQDYDDLFSPSQAVH